MNILVLNGSPRPNGNTAQMVGTFREAAQRSGHTVRTVEVCKKNIHGCLACEYCHGKGQGQCVQKDDMQEIYDLLLEADMLVLASPIYYHNMSGQLKCTIDRFYAVLYPDTPPMKTVPASRAFSKHSIQPSTPLTARCGTNASSSAAEVIR